MASPYTEIDITDMEPSKTIGFVYKINEIVLQPVDDALQTTTAFVSRDIINQINDKLKAQNFKVDEATVRPKFIDQQLYLEGFAREIKEAKAVGFFSNRD